jgi:hypothetical protein
MLDNPDSNFEFLQDMNLTTKTPGHHGHMYLFTHGERSNERIPNAPSHPFLLINYSSGPYGPGFLGNIHLSYQFQEQEDISIGHLQLENIELGNPYRTQGFKENLMRSSEKKQDCGRDAGGRTHGENHCSFRPLSCDEDSLRQGKWPQVRSMTQVRQLIEWIAGQKDIKDHGHGDNSCKDGNEKLSDVKASSRKPKNSVNGLFHKALLAM